MKRLFFGNNPSIRLIVQCLNKLTGICFHKINRACTVKISNFHTKVLCRYSKSTQQKIYFLKERKAFYPASEKVLGSEKARNFMADWSRLVLSHGANKYSSAVGAAAKAKMRYQYSLGLREGGVGALHPTPPLIRYPSRRCASKSDFIKHALNYVCISLLQ